MKLELKHLAPYLPYGLQAYQQGKIWNTTVMPSGFQDPNIHLDVSSIILRPDIFKPILRPMSDLIRNIDFDGWQIVPLAIMKHSGTRLNTCKKSECCGEEVYVCEDNEGHELRYFPKTTHFEQRYKCEPRSVLRHYELMCTLFEMHFDVFNLIENGLAIDINTLEK